MTDYILRLAIMLPLVALLAAGSIWAWRKVQPGMGFGQRERAIRVVDAMQLGAMARLAVVEFDSRRLLIAVSRGRVDVLAETAASEFTLPPQDPRA